MISQTLCNGCKSATTKEYVLADKDGLFISFDTAQEAIAWIRENTPGAQTFFNIEHRTLTEGEYTDGRWQISDPLPDGAYLD